MQAKRIIDHLVYAVPDLEEAMDNLESLLGVRPDFGGYHISNGTKNAILNLGNQCYLEILAIDNDNQNIQSPRWMGVDLIEKPLMTRWCVKSESLDQDSQVLQKYNSEMGKKSGGQRKTSDGNLLKWNMILPLAKPEVEVLPFMINWGENSVHPTEKLPDICRLVQLDFLHPHPDIIKPFFEELSLNFKITKSENINIIAHINSPNGIIEIG